jgi:hypothetical protein
MKVRSQPGSVGTGFGRRTLMRLGRQNHHPWAGRKGRPPARRPRLAPRQTTTQQRAHKAQPLTAGLFSFLTATGTPATHHQHEEGEG